MSSKNVPCALRDRRQVLHTFTCLCREEMVCGAHGEQNWHHWHMVSPTQSHAVCAAVTRCSRNLASLSRLTIKRTDVSQLLVCPIRRALCPDPDLLSLLLRNSHSSTPQVSLSTPLTYVHTNTQTRSNRADSVHVSWRELTNQSEQCWRGWMGIFVSLNAFFMLISTDQGT